MPTVNLTLGIQAVAGPQISVTRSVQVEAYDKIDVTVDPGGAGAAEVAVTIQPAAVAKIVLLAITSSVLGKEIVYRAADGGNNSDPVQLDHPQLFIGNSVSLFGVAPKTLKIKNTFPAADASKKAKIEIFVGRQAT